MEVDFRAFAFVVSLAAVVNGLGIVRWLAGFGEYLRRRQSLDLRHDWVFILFAGHQFLLHILLWWSLWGVRDASNFNFLIYLYMLAGPVLLYLGSSLLVPDVDETVDLRSHYFGARPALRGLAYDRLLEGYATVRPVGDELVARIPMFAKMRLLYSFLVFATEWGFDDLDEEQEQYFQVRRRLFEGPAIWPP